MLKKTLNNILKKLWKDFSDLLPKKPNKEDIRTSYFPKNNIVFVEKDDIKIVIGDDITITKQNKKINIEKDLNIVVGGDINIDCSGDINIDCSGNVTIKCPNNSLWRPNTLEYDTFTGLPMGGVPAGITNMKGEDA